MENNSVINSNGTTNYRVTQDQHQQALRRGILDDASSLLIREGPTALSMRRIAQLVGCSTTVLYTMFGSKQGLIEELYLRGFEMIHQALEAVPHEGSSREYIYALCQAYYQFALVHSTYYAIMFSNVIPEYTPSQESRQLGQESLQLLVQAVQKCMDSERATVDEAWEIARIIWATLHGHVSLKLAQYFDHPGTFPQQRLERTLQAIINQLLPVTDEVS
ncbi:MAG: TetR/AcrR family transcriptional regulator [Cyanophyceae cyanobacterium]